MTTEPSPSPTRASLVAIATNGPSAVNVCVPASTATELGSANCCPLRDTRTAWTPASTDPSANVGHVTLAPSAPSAPGRMATGSNPSTPSVRIVVTFVGTSSSSMGFP